MKKNLYDLTAPQKSIWLTEQYFSGTNINNICGTVIFTETMNLEILNKAINNFIKHNDIFKLKFIEENGTLKQFFDSTEEKEFEILELNSKDEISDIEQKLFSRVFNITKELYEFKLFKIKNSNLCGYVINIHHIISDAITLGLVSQKIIDEYLTLLNGEILEQNPNISYETYIHSEQEYFNSKKYENDKLYWETKFETIPNIVSIPSLKNDSNEFSYKATRYNYIISKDKMKKITEFCSNSKISVFNFFMGILSIYMQRVNNIDDFVIGTPILNRSNFNEKNTLGMFINVAPLRITINEEVTAKELFLNIATDSMGLLRHQKYSYQSILENIRKRDTSIPNLYNIVLSYQITKTNPNSKIACTSRWNFNGTCANDIDIHLFDINDTGELNIAYDYKISKYDNEDIENINKRLNYIIDQILENPEIAIKDLEIATPEERDLILNKFNNTKVDYPSDKTIVQLFEEQVELHPDNIAVVFEEQKLTYKELNEKANQLARYLMKNGITSQTVVGIRLNKKLEMIIGILAIIKTGGCYLPINMQYPQDRVNYMLEDSNAKILLCTQDSIITSSIPCINIELTNKSIYNFENTNLNNIISPEDLIYIIYTSGSTGKPKGAMLCHRNVVRLFKNNNFLFNFDANDVWTMFHSFAFDFSVWEMYGALLFGGKLILVSDQIAQDPNLFINLIKKENVTILNQTPTYFYKLQEIDLNTNQQNLNLKYIIFGGEALKPNFIKKFHIKYPQTKLINMYGITETTVHVTFKELLDIDLNYSSSNIGIPIPTLHVIIVDKNLKLLPFGVMGEMCVLGEGVFKGYLNREDLNTTKLINIPEYNNKPIYRSGDTAIMHKDGHLEYIGRIDNQIKLRGFRIELGEIEEKILNYSNIKNCIVTKKVDNLNREFLCAYYLNNENIDISNLRKILSQHLPLYMIPQYFIEISKIPMTLNGKTDYKALPLPSFKKEKQFLKPRNNLDKKIIEIYKNLLHIENINISDSFFELGGDSLTAITICGILNNSLKINISVKDILEKNIIMDLSDYIFEISNTTNKQEYKKIKTNTYNNNLILSSAQKRIFYTSNMNSDLSVYNISGGIEFSEKLDFKKIKEIFDTLIIRHESFRTYFEINDNELYQKILPNLNLNIQSKNIFEKDIDKEFEKFNKNFDLNKAPLIKVLVLYLDNNHTMIFINMHHIISDGTSMQILLEEFCKLYNEETLEEIKYTYKDYTNYEKNFRTTKQYEENKNFWLNEFSGEIPTLNMPTNFSRPATFSYKGAKISTTIDNDLTKQILEISKNLQVTPYMFLLAAYYILLYKYTGQEDMIVGTPIANREIVEFSNIIGMFVNTLAIRKTIDSSKSFNNFLNEIKEKCLNCFAHQNYPFDELVHELNIQRDISRNPIFDVMFIYQNNGMPKLNINNIKTQYYIPDTHISKFDLSLEIIPQENNMLLNLEYCTDLFTKEFAENISKHYIQLIKNILNNVESKISNLEILTLKEKNKIIYDFNNTNVSYDENNYIYKLIDNQCIKTPNYTAITFKNSKITYKELLEKTNSLANYLHAQNIGKNSVVAIMLPRSLELLIAIIATLKTGAAYVPIDPTFPKARIEYMLKNSETSLILTLEKENDYNILNLPVSLNNAELYNNSKLNFKPETQSIDPAYIIYTSGSTGNPKGVIIPHKAITNLALCMNDEVEYLNKDFKNMAMASLTTVSFDIFVFETLISLQKGLNVVIATEDEQVMPNKVNSLFEKNNVIAFQTTPSKMEIIINNKNLIPSLKNIKYITLVGEALTNNLKKSIIESGNITVYNAYGPTETTVFSTYTDVSNYSNITIGKPMHNTQIYILDKDNNICPINVPGELCIGGDGVGIGYKNLESNVKNNYTTNPILNTPMYRTGDLAKFLPNGELMYIGRIDNQIKIRGLRIELEEIENKILEFPKINKTVIMAQTDNKNRKYLVAYLTVTDRISINKLREHLRKHLPKYMLPAYFEILDEFPYTPNGKVDKKRLPIPDIKIANHNYTPARNDFDKKLLDLFEKILNISPIGITDNFFELGGDSLLAINLQIEIMKFTDGISYADIFLNPTVKELADKITNITNTVENLNDTENLLTCNKYIQNYTILPKQIKKSIPGNILLTGATGFLGAHVLNEFIENENGKAYCLLRSEKGMTLEKKLLNKLHFYFDNKLNNLINDRIIIINGDISLDNLGLSNENYEIIKNNVSTIINCAAKVSHFGKYELYKKINVDGVQNLIDFCKNNSKTLYHISTTSITGDDINRDENFKKNITTNIFKENNFYINQTINNVYVKSKFEAEKIIINELQNGLDAYILRVGNLMARYSDGKFQQNIEENAYINRLTSFIQIKHIPDYFIGHTLEFTPIDYCAKAIIKIINTKNNSNRIFHLLNNNRFLIDDLLTLFNKYNIIINAIPGNDFKTLIDSLLKLNNSFQYLNGIISDFDKNGNLDYEQKISISSKFSNLYLKTLNFEWPIINENYLYKFFKNLKLLN